MTERRFKLVGEEFKDGADQSDELANKRGQFIDIYHVVTGKSVRFKCFLKAFSDTINPEWNDETDLYGRMDPISTYKRTGRTISLTFSVVAGSGEEAKRNLERFSLLQTMQYPSYEKANGGASTINAAPLLRVKMLNYIQNSNNAGANAETGGLLGKIDGSLAFTPNIEAGQFDVLGLWGPVLYPKEFDISFSYTVFHEHPLGWVNGKARGQGFSRFPYGVTDQDFEPGGVRGNIPSRTAEDSVEKAKSAQILREDRRASRSTGF